MLFARELNEQNGINCLRLRINQCGFNGLPKGRVIAREINHGAID